MLTGHQVRGARKLLGWSRAELGRRSLLALAFVEAIESTDGPAWLSAEQEGAIRRACDGAGLEFTDAKGDGVKLRRRRR